jgi:8-oxo-dGTP diphosphatase
MSSAADSEGRFMVAVGAVIEDEATGTILLVKRADTSDYYPGIWEDPMGRMKQFEEPEEALRREVREETGLAIEILKPLAVVHDFRGARTAENEWVGVIFWARAASQDVVLSEEHTAYMWVAPERALEIVEHAGVRTDIEALIAARGERPGGTA